MLQRLGRDRPVLLRGGVPGALGGDDRPLPEVQRQAALAFGDVKAYRDLDKPEGVAGESALRLELGHVSRIVSLPGSEKTNVGYSASLLILDEAARPPSALVEAMLPTTAVTGGTVLALTIPAGAKGWFYELWTADNVDDVWERFEITADACPRISEEVLEEQRMTRGERHVQQEFYVSFEADTESFFDPEDLDRALQVPDEPLWFPERN